jgi:hypothetical protein
MLHGPKVKDEPRSPEEAPAMIIKVVREYLGGSDLVGNFETKSELPAVGDTFWYDTRGPFEVIGRAFIYKRGRDNDPAEDVILTVKSISPRVDAPPYD